jgi:hypothetical protein
VSAVLLTVRGQYSEYMMMMMTMMMMVGKIRVGPHPLQHPCCPTAAGPHAANGLSQAACA